MQRVDVLRPIRLGKSVLRPGELEVDARVQGLLGSRGTGSSVGPRAVEHPPATTLVPMAPGRVLGDAARRKLGVRAGRRARDPWRSGPCRRARRAASARRRRCRGDSRAADVVVCFIDRRSELERRIDPLGRAVFPDGGCWIAWPKRASRVPTDMTEDVVREIALPLGLVDNKVCASTRPGPASGSCGGRSSANASTQPSRRRARRRGCYANGLMVMSMTTRTSSTVSMPRVDEKPLDPALNLRAVGAFRVDELSDPAGFGPEEERS